jgi:hypothetical protein
MQRLVGQFVNGVGKLFQCVRFNKGGEAFKVSKERGFISWAVTPNLVRQVCQFV